MTKSPEGQRCRWCSRGFPVAGGPGRPRAFCSQACRQKEYISRLRARDAGLSEAELIVARSELDALHDRLYVLECAIDDVRRDLAEATTPEEVRQALDWVLEAAEPLVSTRLGDTPAEPVT